MYKLRLDNSKNYILGGKADFIVSDINNSNHINFQVRSDVKNKSIYYVKYRSIDWVYIGHIKTKEITHENEILNLPEFFPVNKSITDDMISKMTIFNKLILFIYYLNKLPSNIEILYNGVCSVCGRKLTDPVYIEIGIGKICLEK